ncbi:hypothetical protein [uncultured Campylobacter sp.]|uniref:hypothetical protein n=1 Tax=uncultured Campylobacter sp. TaxID=218934 RepID=UPI002612C48A|nr:hypothetical protein [uncultured Campylobacter sp.]
MRAFDRNFARAARIFDPNFMRGERKPARPCDKIPSGERVLRGDEILNVGGILSDRALNVGEILSGGGILRDCEISSGSGILNLTPRGGIRRGFFRWILRELYAEASPLHLRCKFQSVSGSQTDYKFKRATTLQTDRKFKIAVSLRVACKFKTPMQKFHRGSAVTELLRQKSSSKIVPYNCLKFQNRPYALARLKFQGVMSKMGASSPSAPLKFQISVAALARLKFGGAPNAITRLKFQNAAAAFARSKFRGLSRAAQCCKIRAQGQGG